MAFSQRLRRCFALRFLPPPVGRRAPPAPGRLPPVGGLRGGRPLPPPPDRAGAPPRDALLREPPDAGRRAPAAPLPPEPVARARAGGGRRTEPAEPTRAVSSLGGTRWPLPAGRGAPSRGGAVAFALPG